MMIKFNKIYFGLAILLLIVEVLIALYIRDQIIRPYGGDFLVVIFIYCILKSFINADHKKLAIMTLLFSYLVELLQYLDVITIIGLQHFTIARVIMGTYFNWIDILCYTMGFFTIIYIEYKIIEHKSRYLSIQ